MAIKHDPNYNPNRDAKKLFGQAMLIVGIIVIGACVFDNQDFYGPGIGLIIGGWIRLATLPKVRKEIEAEKKNER